MKAPLAKPKTIWFISKYASSPGSNSASRGFSLAREFGALGHDTILINSRANHNMHHLQRNIKQKFGAFSYAENWGVRTWTHQTLGYTASVSLLRVLSWIHFELGLLALPTKRLPRPTHIIVSSLSLLTVLNAYRIARKFKACLVFEVRDIWPLTLTVQTSLTTRNIAVRILGWIEKFGYKNADVVVGTMPNLSEHVRAILGYPVRVETIGNGVDRELQEIAVSQSIPSTKSQFRLSYAGSVGRSNALHQLLEVANSFSVKEQIIFDFYGKGDYLDELKMKYGDNPNIVFHGSCPRLDLLEKLKSSDAFMFSADDTEMLKFGQSAQKIVDYMALGRPIIGTYSGFPSMINEADCGVLVPSDDAQALREQILRLRDMPASERYAMGERGKTWILEHRTYGNLAQQYLEILDSL